MKLAIVGAGWYGCHIARKMLHRNFEVVLFDKSDEILSGASYKNQNRLHQGFHYPRCSKTRSQSRRGFHLFKKEYRNVLKSLDYNLYAIARKNSILDFETYRSIMSSASLNFEDVSKVCPINVEDVEGVLDCEEEYICPDKARKMFAMEIGHIFCGNEYMSTQDVNGLRKEFDYVIDCTWGHFQEFHQEKIFFESCLYHTYSSEMIGNIALTVMDGDFFSIFPHGEKKFTVTCVPLIVANKYKTQAEAYHNCKELACNKELTEENRTKVENLIRPYLPAFNTLFTYEKPEFSVKTKFPSGMDSRYVKIFTSENRVSILSGKIDTIFDADAMVMSYIRSRI